MELARVPTRKISRVHYFMTHASCYDPTVSAVDKNASLLKALLT